MDDYKNLCRQTIIADLEHALEQQPDAVDLLKQLCSELEKAGFYQKAVQAYKRFIHNNPSKLGPVAQLALLLYKVGDHRGGVELASRLTRDQPDAPFGWLAYGSLLIHERKYPMAEQALKQALKLNPKLARAHLLLGRIYNTWQLPLKAEDAFGSAVKLNPGLVEAHEELGNYYINVRYFEKAIKHYNIVLGVSPTRGEIRAKYAGCLFAAGDETEAQQQFQQMVKQNPDNLRANVGLCMTQIPAVYNTTEEIKVARGNYQKELRNLERAFNDAHIAGKSGLIDALGFMQPFYLPYQGMNDRDLQIEYGSIAHGCMAKESSRFGFDPELNITRGNYTAERPINLAIVTGHVFHHSVWNAITKGWIASLDKNKYRISLFATSLHKDAETKWAEDNCGQFIQGIKDINSWCRAISEGNPDIVFFPEVGMDPITLQLAALRHASVQCASWGHPETTGLPTIDYFISADLLEPPDGDNHYSEKLIRLPGIGCAPYPKPEKALQRERNMFGLDPDRPAFLCSQSLYKYLPIHDEILIKIAHRLPHAIFVFFELDYCEGINNKFSSRMKRSFESAGLDFKYHCRFLKRLSLSDYHSLSKCMDVYLDTIHFSGFNTALGGLACGLPVVTHEGAYMRGRLAAALLRYIDITDTVARTIDEYVEIAHRLIENPNWRIKICEKIDKRLPRVWACATPIKGLDDFLKGIVAPAGRTISGG